MIRQGEARKSLVIMATHGMTEIRRCSSGCIANQVLREAGVPVLLVHPPL
jgi:nucleotide-binding universal stress UspA family protein